MAIVYHKSVIDHKQWEGHPESPFRIKTLKKKLIKEGLWNDVMPPIMINDDDVLKVHTIDHLERLKKGGNVAIDPDTMLWDNTYGQAMLSASIATTAVRMAMKGIPAFAMTRPPGHHARKGAMGGFCYLNNAAIAVEAAGVRTAIVDIDAHHGNGTEEIFYDRPDVLFIDMHESGLYTGTGRTEDIGTGKGERYTVNIPVPPYSGNKTYREAMNSIVVPILRDFQPELIVISLGVDAHYCDTHSHINLNTDGYVDLCRTLIGESTGGRLACILEGGYHLRSTAEVVAGIGCLFEGKEMKAEYNEEKPESTAGPREVRKIAKHHGQYWDLGCSD
jgi:acetoin utilization deacetylase AcuC-like enzyme